MKITAIRNHAWYPAHRQVPNHLALLLVMSLSLFNGATADTSVWVITSGSNTVYLGGTVHLLRPTDYPLPEEYEQAYQASSEIYFETDISAMTDFSVQAQMLQQLSYNDERTLKTVLNTEAYTALSAYAGKLGLPLMMLEKFKPGMVVSTLQLLEFQKMGFTPQGVDNYFNTRAIEDAKTLGQLESIEQQIGFLAAMGEGNESEFILLSLRDLEETEAAMEEMIGAWREGNNDKLEKMFIADMQAEAPELYDSLLLQRNLNWIPQIESMLRDADTEFVLVGAAHLVGNQGLLELLSQKGFQVKQL
ncbi:MAG: TraB/GumN family protein [Proteobacteria bacterium]|nr:TraB/GumN family protein [Pseudomonadota bacterium]